MKTYYRDLPNLSPEARALLARLPAETATLLAAQVQVGRTLAELQQVEPVRFAGPAGMGELGERHGLAAEEARVLAGLGRAVNYSSEIDVLVRAGQIPTASASLLGEVLPCEWLQRPGDEWLRWAQTETTKQLRQRVWQRREEGLRDRRPVVPLSVYVSHEGMRNFRRARCVASRKAKKALSAGQTLECLADTYLDRFDPARVRPGQRQLPDTRLVMVYGAGALKGGFRYVPREVCREVFARQHERCAVPFCGRDIFLEKAHVVAHSHGGAREADDLLGLCSYHHRLLDSGRMRMEGTAANPRFFDEEGRDLSQRLGALPPVPAPVSAVEACRSAQAAALGRRAQGAHAPSDAASEERGAVGREREGSAPRREGGGARAGARRPHETPRVRSAAPRSTPFSGNRPNHASEPRPP